jgi:hypothetical protein
MSPSFRFILARFASLREYILLESDSSPAKTPSSNQNPKSEARNPKQIATK